MNNNIETNFYSEEILAEAKCFLCNKHLNETQNGIMLLFEKRIGIDGYKNQPLSDVLSTILSIDLQESTAHSKIICEKCTKVVQEFEIAEMHYQNLRDQILKKFSKTAKLNNLSEVIYNNSIDINTIQLIEENYESTGDSNAHQINYGYDDDDDDDFNIIQQPPKNIQFINHNNDGNIIENSIEKSRHNNVIDNTIVNEENQIGELNVVRNENNKRELIFEDENSFNRQQQIVVMDVVIKDESIVKNDLAISNNSFESEIVIELDNHLNTIKNCIENAESQVSLLSTYNKMKLTSTEQQKKQKRKSRSIKLSKAPSSTYKIYNNKAVCLICNPLFNNNDDGSSTMINFDDDQSLIFQFDLSTISLHMKTEHALRLLICDNCGEEFQSRNELHNHIKERHEADVKIYNCNICNKIFQNIRSLDIHKRLHNIDENKMPESSESAAIPALGTSKYYNCTECEKKFVSKNLLKEHMNTHLGIRPYKCSFCVKNFASKYTLMSHIKIHQNRPRPYECDKCTKAFLSLQNLRQHVKTHTGVKEFNCDECNKSFGTQHNLDVHKIVHSKIKPFECQDCGKSFARRAEIQDHKRTHTGEKPFQCNMCESSFAQRSNLITHKKATHFNEKRHKCDQCEKSFKRRRLLDYHIRAAHTGERPYKCGICDASFVYPEHFKKHNRIHNGEKPFKCEVCNKPFNSRDNRNAHRFIHSDKKPYECYICGQGFMRKPLLFTHMYQTGHISDTIVVNQPHISKEGKIKINQENQVIEEEYITSDKYEIDEAGKNDESNLESLSTKLVQSNNEYNIEECNIIRKQNFIETDDGSIIEIIQINDQTL